MTVASYLSIISPANNQITFLQSGHPVIDVQLKAAQNIAKIPVLRYGLDESKQSSAWVVNNVANWVLVAPLSSYYHINFAISIF